MIVGVTGSFILVSFVVVVEVMCLRIVGVPRLLVWLLIVTGCA